MNTNLFIILSAALISLVSFSGVLLASKKINTWFFKKTKLLITFSAGIFTMTSIGLMGETFESLEKQTAIISIVGGFLAILILHKLLPETHHHEDTNCPNCIKQKSSIKLVTGDIIHNISDGIILVVAFVAGKEIGIITAVSILTHEIIQEISEYIILRNSGYSTKKTLSINFLSSLSIFLGIGIGFLLTKNTELRTILLGISAGIFLHLVFHDLFPYDSVKKITQKESWKHIGIFLLGIIIMASIGFIVPHTHNHEEVHESNY